MHVTTARPAGPGEAADRLALAADLHDLVAHRVTAIVVQAAALDLLLPGPAARLEREVGALLALAREALGEARRLGRLLDDGRPAALAPLPALDAVAALLPEGADAVAPGVAVCAHRCVELLAPYAAGVVLSAGPASLDLRASFASAPPAGLAARVRTGLRPCAGTLRIGPAHEWRLVLPLAA